VASAQPAGTDPAPAPAASSAAASAASSAAFAASQAASATADALAGLVETEEYRRWVAKNHHRLGARAAAESDDEDGSDY